MLSIMGLIRCRKGALAKHEVQEQAGEGENLLNLVQDRTQKGISYIRGAIEPDAISQVFASDVAASMVAAEARQFDLAAGLGGDDLLELKPLLTLQNTVIEPPEPARAAKRMSLLKRRPEISGERFQDEWFNLHATLLKRMPGIMGYRQNLVIDGPKDENGLLVDGVVELWFRDGAAIEAAFRSDRGHTTMSHAKEFISEITTYMVEPVSLAAG